MIATAPVQSSSGLPALEPVQQTLFGRFMLPDQSEHPCQVHGITIDGQYGGAARARVRLGRRLPAWFGCRTLRAGELFVMNPAAPDSFDGRYFGPLKIENVIGRATPVWTDEAGDGRHVWFAQPHFYGLSQPNEGDLP